MSEQKQDASKATLPWWMQFCQRLKARLLYVWGTLFEGAVQVELGLVSRPTTVQNAASLSLHLPDQPDQPLPPHTTIREAYELAQHESLILGETGAGRPCTSI